MLIKPDSCRSCVGWNWGPKGSGYVPADGSGEKGVLVVAEAAGEHEQIEGMPLVGKAGHYLFTQLQRVGIEREGLRLHNVLSCRPPDNKLVNQPYEREAVLHCTPFLDETIRGMEAICGRNGRHLTIVTLGVPAFKRIMDFDWKNPILSKDYYCYPFWNEKYQAWVIAAPHPSFLMRGNHKLVPILQFVFQRALEIAERGLVLAKPTYLLDPEPCTFAQWADDYMKELERNPEVALSYDIETPYKVGKEEDELAKDDEGDDYTILRCSFSYRPNDAVSVPWTASYRPILESLFGSKGAKVGWNSENYDLPRVSNQLQVNGDQLDAMLMWHVLNSSLDKRLGFVTPFYAQDVEVWKHESKAQPAFYNAKDADMALRNYIGIRRDLTKNSQWPVFDRHIIKLNRVLSYMSGKGIPLDQEMRNESEVKLQSILDITEIKMEAAIPKDVRKFKIYKKLPKVISPDLIEDVINTPIKYCGVCGVLKPTKSHSKLCPGWEVATIPEPTTVWKLPLDFKISKKSLQSYQKSLRHQAILSRKDRKITFDESALMKLIKHHPNDPLYPLIIEFRKVQKLLSTNVGVTQLDGKIRGGMPVGRDGRIHTMYNHNPNTLRLASQNPNLQNLQRPNSKDKDDLGNIVRNLIVAPKGSIFLARDYSGIEAVLVGFFASSPSYIRLSKIDVHSFYTAYALNQLDGRVKSNDLPLLSWDDAKLTTRLAEIKEEFKADRNNLFKHLIHGANYFQGPAGAQAKIYAETGKEYPVKLISQVMGVYFELFPDIKRWHNQEWLQAEKDGFARNPFGYVLKFSKVFDYEKVQGKWVKKPGPDANKVCAFKPQSTCAAIIKEAMLRLYYDRFEEAGQYMRLQVHDEVLCEVPEDYADKLDNILKFEMEKPIPELRLPASFNMGEMLSIDTESKRGARWGLMR